MEIKALGGCCKKSMANYDAICEAVKELGLTIKVEHITDMNEIINLGVMSTPGLVINNQVVASGRCLTVKEAKELIKKLVQKN